jgi:hypothetical protein
VLFDEILRRTGASHILEVFPDMEVFFHGAVSFTPYEKLFQRYLPSPRMHYMEIYNASEGFFAFQDQAHTKDLLLLTDHGIFYEFIPFLPGKEATGRPFPSKQSRSVKSMPSSSRRPGGCGGI